MLARLGTLLFTAIFLHGGWQQINEPTPRAEQGRKLGLPVSDRLVQLSGGAMILTALGLQIPALRRVSAAILAAQMPVVTGVGHRFWEHEPGPQRNAQRAHFFKNLTILGGCLYLVACPPRR